MNTKIENLFEEVNIILNEITSNQKASEDFNIFSTLGVELLETRHSKFIAELLNSKGSHGCEDLFLKQFLTNKAFKDQIKDNELFFVETEQFHIVEKNQSYIDIVMESNDTVIIIENKIYAPDQPKQLYRYHKAKQRESSKKIIIIYLTLNGKEPSGDSVNGLERENISLFSYEEHIYNWLNSVLEKIKYEKIKIIVRQYLDLLEKLTNKNSKEEDMKIADKLLENDNMQTALKIAQALPRAKAIFEMNFYKLLQNELNISLKDFGFEIYKEDDWHWNFNEKDIEWIMKIRTPNNPKVENGFNGLYFYKKLLKNEKFLFLKIGDDSENRLYCDSFLSFKHNKLKSQKFRKTDFKETQWIVEENYVITIAGEEFPDVFFGKYDEIYLKTNDEIKIIVSEITHILKKIIQSDAFHTLEKILSNN